MSAFTRPLTVTQLADWRLWRLEESLRYEVGALGSGRVIEVPAGFVTDGASVPRWLWSLLPAWGSYSRAACLHDFGLHVLSAGRPHPEMPTRLACDHVFREAMDVCGTPLVIRLLLYAGVRFRALTAT
jgi:hypothetical protein